MILSICDLQFLSSFNFSADSFINHFHKIVTKFYLCSLAMYAGVHEQTIITMWPKINHMRINQDIELLLKMLKLHLQHKI